MDLSFFDDFVAYSSMVSVTIIFVLSLSNKYYDHVVKKLDHDSAKKHRRIFRIIGPILVLLGIIQYSLKHFL